MPPFHRPVSLSGVGERRSAISVSCYRLCVAHSSECSVNWACWLQCDAVSCRQLDAAAGSFTESVSRTWAGTSSIGRRWQVLLAHCTQIIDAVVAPSSVSFRSRFLISVRTSVALICKFLCLWQSNPIKSAHLLFCPICTKTFTETFAMQ